ncbi:YciI family protein [Tropicibacter naphthalenivorans]|uniref:YCII-related domain protein n=1 Tax=Tropicibacter naphthalenivorans TaxID=441103 RepID=A0A0P1GWY2_9RHOB|nr:YciI family protein [Tropicibacter naphthalenivorans]CUH79564.1 YCII-related domain protein [Tropicibacter naphthalenivorans]SMC73545.1 Uncharacterized conserved protein YciI, contains a putative active-site phosphohistidine [Tropicibacter naphthalenivorans]
MLIPENHSLFAIDIHYDVPIEQIEEHLDAHMDFIAKARADGFLLAAGAQVPRTGGFIVAIAPDLQTVEARMATDPFTKANLVTLTITQFKPGTVHPALADL